MIVGVQHLQQQKVEILFYKYPDLRVRILAMHSSVPSLKSMLERTCFQRLIKTTVAEMLIMR